MHLAITLIVLVAIVMAVVLIVRRTRKRRNEVIAQRAADITSERLAARAAQGS